MKKNLLPKTLFIISVVVLCLFSITGVPHGFGWSAIKQSMAKRIHLGLDLQGGTHLILQVHVNDAVRAEVDQDMGHLQDALGKAGIGFASIAQPDKAAHPGMFQVHGIDPARAGNFREVAQNTLGNGYQVASLSNEPNGYQISLTATAQDSIRQRALQQSIETIGNRINQLGVTEPTVQQHGLGAYQILVQLPGVSDPARVKDVIQRTAMLSIHLVKGGPFSDQATALSQYNGVLPPDTELLQGNDMPGSTGASKWYLLDMRAIVNGPDLRPGGTSAGTDQYGQPMVNFTLTRAAGDRFGTFTGAHIGQPMAIVLDNRVQEVANIKSEIHDQGEITGQFTTQQAQDLALLLRSGALPASITYSEEEVVGPSLGRDSIRAGVQASIAGFLVVAIFMLIYYKGAGINAVLSLVLNLIILMAFMALVSATLTLPGIAGIILTIGMAVDSNVLIFERIREELRHGRSTGEAVQIGFDRAFHTILDTHVTTVVSAIILFLFGTGPIKGFAVTLTVGLVANLFTAVFVSRVIFDYLLSKAPRGAQLSI